MRPEFYGDRLSAVLKAGRGIEVAPQFDAPNPLDRVSAHELEFANLAWAFLRLAEQADRNEQIYQERPPKEEK